MNRFSVAFTRLVKPKFYKTKALKTSISKILDIGIANNSYQEAKSIFPEAKYTGVDMFPIAFEMHQGDQFFLANLESLSSLDFLADAKFDLIIASHVLEHLINGEQIYRLLCQRLRPGGLLYAEFPSIRTAYQQKTKRSYHFHDDPTHRRLYQLESLANIAMKDGCKIISCGPARTPLKLLLSLPRALLAMALGQPSGSAMLFIQGKIDYILVQYQEGGGPHEGIDA